MNPQELKKLEKKILLKLSQQIKPGDTVILGLSGGADSVFLHHFLAQSPCTLITAHLNHGLRDQAADRDEQFCEKLATNHLHYSKKVKISSGNQEEKGRDQRYKFFNTLAKKHQAKYLLTAHHADDNLETILLNLTRGATLQGLSGMEELNNNLFRPLLDISKKEILAYLKAKHIPYCRDATNNDLKYSRNRIRLKVLPELKKLNPNIAETIAKNANQLRQTLSYLNSQAEKWLKTQTIPHLNAHSFRKQQPAIQKQILIKLAKNSQNIESVHLEEVLNLINNNIGNKKKTLGKLTFAIKNNIIHVQKK